MNYSRCHKFLEKIALVIALSLAACAHQESFEEGGSLEDFAAAEDMSEMAAMPSEGDMLGDAGMTGEGVEPLPQDIELGDFSDPALNTEPLPETAGLMTDEAAPSDFALTAPETAGQEMLADPLAVGMDNQPVAPDALNMEPPMSMEPAAPMSVEPMAMDSMDTQPVESPAKVEADYSPKPRKRLKAPLVAEKPFQSHGDSLNRFYVVRKGDTAESVAQLLLGDEQLSSQIRKWNPAVSWNAGAIVYYASPEQKDDSQMRSFHEERGIVAGEYSVGSGETLAQIAEREYGDASSWKEIAVLNQIRVPSKVDAGATLKLFPKNLAEYSYQVKEEVAKLEPKDSMPIDREINDLETEIASMEKEIDDIAQAKAPAISDVAVAPEPPPATQAELQKGKQLASVEVNGFLRQNLALILIIAGLGTFLLFYFFVKKSKDLGGDF